MVKYYAIAKGIKVGIFTNWDVVKSYVNGYSGAKYKSFQSIEEARNYLLSFGINDYYYDDVIIEDRENENKDIIVQNNSDNIMYIYTDGSYTEGRGGIGLVYVFNNEVMHTVSSKVHEYPTTNNRAELLAIYAALYTISIQNNQHNMKYVLYSDSEYSVKAYNEYINNWLKNGFIGAKGEGVKNQDLIIKSWTLLSEIKNKASLEIRWIKAHVDNKYNNQADELAKKGRDS